MFVQISHDDVLQPAIFTDPGFVEIFRSIKIEVRIIAVEPDPAHPTRPKIHFAGDINHHATMVGCVWVTPDNRIRWHFVRRFHWMLGVAVAYASSGEIDRNQEIRVTQSGGSYCIELLSRTAET